MAILILSSVNYRKEVRLILIIGVLILLFEPLGSAGGISTAGRHSLWIIFPLAVDYILNIKVFYGKFNILYNNQEEELSISASQDQLDMVKKYFIGMSVFACIYFSYYYPYFDVSDRIKMTAPIENKLAKGIYTTKERATVINELLMESSKYIKKDEYVLAYDCIPMFHYLTETEPYIPNTWPWLCLPEEMKQELEKANSMSKKLPVIVLQKMSTLNTDWPQNIKSTYKRSEQESARDSILFDFMNNHGYTKIWENKAFEIRIPRERL